MTATDDVPGERAAGKRADLLSSLGQAAVLPGFTVRGPIGNLERRHRSWCRRSCSAPEHAFRARSRAYHHTGEASRAGRSLLVGYVPGTMLTSNVVPPALRLDGTTRWTPVAVPSLVTIIFACWYQPQKLPWKPL